MDAIKRRFEKISSDKFEREPEWSENLVSGSGAMSGCKSSHWSGSGKSQSGQQSRERESQK